MDLVVLGDILGTFHQKRQDSGILNHLTSTQ